jgi:hypothetical protein
MFLPFFLLAAIVPPFEPESDSTVRQNRADFDALLSRLAATHDDLIVKQ